VIAEQMARAQLLGARLYLNTSERPAALALLGSADVEGGQGPSKLNQVSFAPDMSHPPTRYVLSAGSMCRLIGMASESIAGKQLSPKFRNLMMALLKLKMLKSVIVDEADTMTMASQGHEDEPPLQSLL
jgi:hypothetical protein